MDEELPAASGRDSTKNDPTRGIEGGRWYDDEDDKVQSEPEATNEPMKTMTELAAEYAERQRRLGLGSTRASKLTSRSVRPLRAPRKTVDEDEDLSEPSLSDYLSDSPASGKRKANSSGPNPRSSTKPTPKSRNKRARNSEGDEDSSNEYDRSSRSKSAPTGPRSRRKTATRATKAISRSIRTVSGPSVTSTAVPASDRVLRSKKARV